MTNAKSKATRREEARKAGKCVECLKARARVGRVTCKPCVTAAVERRDRNVAAKRLEEAKAERKRTRVSAERSAKSRAAKTRGGKRGTRKVS